MFPFSLTYREQILYRGEETTQAVASAVKRELNDLEVEFVCSEGEKISFKNPYFIKHGRFHPMAIVSSGFFLYNPSSHELLYSISFRNAFIFVVIVSILFGLDANSIAVGLKCFGWLYGGNLLINYFKHRKILKRIASNVPAYITTLRTM